MKSQKVQHCYFSPNEKHKFCNHKQDCILKGENWEFYDKKLQPIILEIKRVRKLIKEYENIYQNLLNNDIIYHDTLDEYYIIEKKIVDGKTVIEANVTKNFKNVLRREMNNLKMELRDWNIELLHTKRR